MELFCLLLRKLPPKSSNLGLRKSRCKKLWLNYCLYSLSPGSASFRFRHVGGRGECLLDGLLTLLSLLTQDVPWASMERTARWCASVRTEPTATTSPGSVPAARASWGSAASRVSVSAQHPWVLLFPKSQRSYVTHSSEGVWAAGWALPSTVDFPSQRPGRLGVLAGCLCPQNSSEELISDLGGGGVATRMKAVFKFSVCSSWLSLPPLLIFGTWLLRALKEPVKFSSWQRQNLISRWRNVHTGGLGAPRCVC